MLKCLKSVCLTCAVVIFINGIILVQLRLPRPSPPTTLPLSVLTRSCWLTPSPTVMLTACSSKGYEHHKTSLCRGRKVSVLTDRPGLKEDEALMIVSVAGNYDPDDPKRVHSPGGDDDGAQGRPGFCFSPRICFHEYHWSRLLCKVLKRDLLKSFLFSPH